MFKDSEVKGNPKTAQIIIEPTDFFICIPCEHVPIKFVSENQPIGLDMGIADFCIDSNGNFVANPKHFKCHERRLRIENRSLPRKKRIEFVEQTGQKTLPATSYDCKCSQKLSA